MAVYDVAVVGGGIVGIATAYHLAKAGASTVLVDRADPGRATDAAAGILSAETYGGDHEPWFEFSLTAARYYEELIADLIAAGCDDCGYEVCGALIVAVTPDEDEPFARAYDRLRQRQRRGRVPSAPEVGEIDVGAAAALVPGLAPPRRALYSRAGARIDGRRLAAALRVVASQAGLQYILGSVESLSLRGERVVAAYVGDRRLRAREWVIAGGAWTGQLALTVGLLLPIAPQRGQLIHLRLDDATTGDWPIVEGFRGHYLVPWRDGRVVVGATRETGSGFSCRATREGLALVLEEAVRLLPSLDGASLGEVRVGLRPLTADGLPVIGRIPSAANLYLATGHGAHGLQIGPYTGKVVAELLSGRPADLPIEFSPQRFCS